MIDDAKKVHELAKKFLSMAEVAHHAAQEQTDHHETFMFNGRAGGLQDAAKLALETASEMLDKKDLEPTCDHGKPNWKAAFYLFGGIAVGLAIVGLLLRLSLHSS